MDASEHTSSAGNDDIPSPKPLALFQLYQVLYVKESHDLYDKLGMPLPQPIQLTAEVVQGYQEKLSDCNTLVALDDIRRWVTWTLGIAWDSSAVVHVGAHVMMRRPHLSQPEILSLPLVEIRTILQEPLEPAKVLEAAKRAEEVVPSPVPAPLPPPPAREIDPSRGRHTGNAPHLKYEDGRYSLYYGSAKLHSFKGGRRARQLSLLQEFRNAGWPAALESSLERALLRRTVIDLNRTLRGQALRFSIDERGRATWHEASSH